ncbi:MAG: hypothetical protein ACK546_00135 [bacterium]|jgi:hypothetical protein
MNDEDLGPSEAAFVLQWLGVALLLAYGTSVLAATYPFEFLDPAWQQTFCDNVRGGASFPAAACGLFVVALQFDPLVQPLQRQLVTLRRLALAAAIGFLLLIPLQMQAGFALLQQAREQDLGPVRELAVVIQNLRNATSEPGLRQAIAGLPGAPRLEGRRFNAPFETVRDSLVRQLEPQMREAEARVRRQASSRLPGTVYRAIREAVMAAAFALGFAAFGQSGPGQPTLLETLSFHWLAPRPEPERPWQDEDQGEQER